MAIRRTWVIPALAISMGVLLISGGAVAALETGTVGSFPKGLWWSLSLLTTVGFLGPIPTTTAGAILSVILMLLGFVLLALVSAALASLFVREDSSKFEVGERVIDQRILDELALLQKQVTALEAALETRHIPPAQ